ncbi:MAG: tetratricopeptide repeat protein [Gemmataceae bacterium]|nr:tetratricopeptide repeat protein [Gemmataceae bacterium]
MKRAWWLLPAVPVAGLVVLEVAGDWLFGVREARPTPPGDIPPAEARAHVRESFGSWSGPDHHPARPDLTGFLGAIGTAGRAGRASDAAGSFDCDRLYAEITRSDLFTRSGLPLDPSGGPRLLRTGLWDAVHEGGPGLDWDRVEIRKVAQLPGGDELLVYAKHSAGHRSAPYRWWLIRSPAGWKVYDVEDVRIGLRLSRQAAGLFARGGANPPELLAGLKALRAASDLLDGGKADAADAALVPARVAMLPRDQFVLRCVLEGAVAAMRGRPTEALEWAARADAITPALPAVDYLRASAYAAAGNWADAAEHARRYVDQLGPDAAACRILGRALRETGRPAEAAAAFEQGLRDDPTREDLRAALAELRRMR